MPGKRLRDAYLNRRMAALLALGFGAGVPLMLTGRTMKVWAGDVGVDLATVGLFSLLTLPYSFKFVWAPVLDRIAPPLLDRRRGWLLIIQCLLVAAIAAMGAIGPVDAERSLVLFGAAAVLVAFLSASQDIVADAYRTDILSPVELGAGASVYVSGYRVAMLSTGAGAVALAAGLAWGAVYATAAGLMLVPIIATACAPRPPGVAPPATIAAAVIEPAREFMTRNRWRAGFILAFIITFKLPDYMAGALGDVLLLRLGFAKEEIAFWGMGVGIAVTIPGVLAGGPIVVRLGLRRALFIMGAAQAASNAGYFVLASVGQNMGVMIAVIGIEYFCMGLVAAGFVAFLMSQCDHRYSATQFALLSSLMGASSALGGAATGAIVDHIGWQWFFAITIAAGVPGMAMIGLLPSSRDQARS
jgi:PAT family beta-lactamase induction signal transducer AmpG